MKDRIWDILFWIVVTVFLLVLFHAARRIFWFDQFVIPTSSMEPTLIPGDRILVNKTIIGPRIYSNFDFKEGAALECKRLKGKRGVCPNDIIVFNFPYGWHNREIAFKINFIYAKRCIGTPGDSVGISKGWFVNNRYAGIIGDVGSQRSFEQMTDEMIGNRYLKPGWMRAADTTWTIHDFGPLYVPEAGGVIALDECNAALYGCVVKYETGFELERTEDGLFCLNGQMVECYTFRQNYYFACGDNIADSNDSRHWGFIPEDFIVGVASRISYSKDSTSNKIRIGRFMKKLST